jgi:hypothetical protein|tara:strand:- start:1044 stop:1625 length:582 start_codon:yes stop_codon:yes gene_type:complete
MKKILVVIFFFLFYSSYSHSLDKQDIQKLKDLNYPLESFYMHNYKGSKTYWIPIEKHLELKPKYLALVNLDVNLNGKNTTYGFIYNSRHNFFKMKKINLKKNFYEKLYFFSDKTELQPELMDDEELNIDTFAEKVLDHCHFSSIKGVNNLKGKSLKFTKKSKCTIKYVNFVQFEKLTFEKYEKNSNVLSFSIK